LQESEDDEIQEIKAVEEKSKTTYESCSSYHSSEDEQKEERFNGVEQLPNRHQPMFVKRNIALDLD
jgi:hypothetical protein